MANYDWFTSRTVKSFSKKNKEILEAFTEEYRFTFDGVVVKGAIENLQLLAEEFKFTLINDSNNKLH